MMADPVVSSPLGDRKHYDIFQQPSSPKQQHDDLPAEFGDQSFGSSMSLGSSFELNRLAASPSASSMLCVQSVPPHCTLQSAPPISLQKSPPRTFPESLGAAMGTILNSRTPGLAAKMSSPFSMDMSPTSIHITPTALGNGTPSKGKPPGSNLVTSHSEEQLPPGSAMKEDPPEAQQTHSTVSGGSLSATPLLLSPIESPAGLSRCRKHRSESFKVGLQRGTSGVGRTCLQRSVVGGIDRDAT